MGEIQRIDVVSKTTEKGEKFNRVFVHFKRWFANENADMARERLLNGKEIKIVYDDPWFWKVSAYREAKKNDHPDREQRPRASIRFDDDREQRPSERPREQAGRPSERRQDRPYRNEKSKEFLDKELEKINPTIPDSMKIDKTLVQADLGTGGIVYDMDVVNSTKRRKIVIKKDPVVKPVPLKIEAEAGELSESDWLDDGLR